MYVTTMRMSEAASRIASAASFSGDGESTMT